MNTTRVRKSSRLDLARIMNLELKELVRAGAKHLQIDEPYYSGFPEDLPWGVRVLNALVDGVNARITLHICYGNRYGKPTWAGNYRYLFPTILDAKVHQLSLEFARRGGEDLDLFKEFSGRFEVGVGVIDVKDHEIETPDLVAERIRKAAEFVPVERMFVLPDCGCLHLPQSIAFSKAEGDGSRRRDRSQRVNKVEDRYRDILLFRTGKGERTPLLSRVPVAQRPISPRTLSACVSPGFSNPRWLATLRSPGANFLHASGVQTSSPRGLQGH